MGDSPSDVRRTLGGAARLWASPEHHAVSSEWWVALSGEKSVTYNVACCQSADADVLTDRCLQPVLDLGRPATIMLAGPGLATAQTLADLGWVTVAALPLMVLTAPSKSGDDAAVRHLSRQDLSAARELLADNYGLDPSSAAAAIPDRALESDDMGVWGLFDLDRLVACVTTVIEDRRVVVWSMATRTESQKRGYGRRLLDSVLVRQFAAGVAGSLLQSSAAGESLYRSVGYQVAEYWQVWSRPRWVLGRA
jgi:ribosomal protein S18 acetylase RimI-like enzyme